MTLKLHDSRALKAENVTCFMTPLIVCMYKRNVRMNLRKIFFLVFVANAGSLASYLFQVLCARSMSPEAYGVFNALNSLSVLAIAPLPVLVLLISRMTISFSSSHEQEIANLWKFILKMASGAALLVASLGFLFAPFIQRYLHLSSIKPVYIIVLIIAVSFLVPAFVGILQGLRLYLFQVWVMALWNWGRLLAGGLLALDRSLSVGEALLSGLIGIGIALAFAWYILRHNLPLPPSPSLSINIWHFFKKEIKQNLPFLAFSYVLVALFINADLILARHYLPPQEVGLYSVAAIIGRIGFYLPGILVAVIFSETVRQTSLKGILKIGGVAYLFSLSFAVLAAFFPGKLICLLMGAKYTAAASYLRIIAIGMSFLGLANISFSYFLGKTDFGYLKFFSFLTLITFGAIVFRLHQSPSQIALAITCGAFLAWCYSLFLVFKGERKCC